MFKSKKEENIIGSIVDISASFITLKSRLTTFIKYTIMSFFKKKHKFKLF